MRWARCWLSGPWGSQGRSAAGPPFVEVAFKGSLFPAGTPACLALCHELLHGDRESGLPLFYSQKYWSSGTPISLLRSCSAELSVLPHLSCSRAVRGGLGARILRTGDACSVSSADAVQGAGHRDQGFLWGKEKQAFFSGSFI